MDILRIEIATTTLYHQQKQTDDDDRERERENVKLLSFFPNWARFPTLNLFSYFFGYYYNFTHS